MTHVIDHRQQYPIVFSDLDGTLLDHENYSFTAAQAMLHALRAASIPVIPVTSKTRTEVLALREQMQLDTPFVVENGAAIFIPHALLSETVAHESGLTSQQDFWVKAFAPPRAQWLRWLEHVAEQLPDSFTCFSWMQTMGIVEATGLTPEQATAANTRDFSEPVLWQGSEAGKARFARLAEHQGYSVIEGGRFLHVTSGYDKGQALRWLVRLYDTLQSKPVVSVALGDSGNDIDMLEAADFACAIRSPVKGFPAGIEATHIQYSEAHGPAGWQECLNKLFTLNA